MDYNNWCIYIYTYIIYIYIHILPTKDGEKKRLWRFLFQTPKKRDWAKFAGQTYTQSTWCVWCFRWLGDLKKWENFGTTDLSNGFLLPKNSQNLTSCWSGFLSGCHFRSNTLNSLGHICGVTVGQWDPKLSTKILQMCCGGFLRDLLDILKWLPDLQLPLSSHPISIILPSSHLAKWQECLPQNLSNLDNFD